MTRLGRVGGLALVALAVLAGPADAREGELDPTFGNGGYVLTPEPGHLTDMGEIATAPDGDIFLAGTHSAGSITIPFTTQGWLVRIASDGTAAAFIASMHHASAQDVAVQPDGKVVVAGTAYAEPSPSDDPDDGDVPVGLGVWRYNPDGSPDTSFGDGGKTVITRDPALYPHLGQRGLDLAPDGRILVGGGNFVARLDQDGSVEQSYTEPAGWEIGAVVAGNDGSVMVAGSMYDPGPCCQVDDWLLRRLTETLTPDPTFTPPVLGPGSTASDLAVQSNGRVLVLGHASDGSVLLARFMTTGELDPSFGFDGAAHPDAIALDQQQRILLTEPGLLERLNADGTPDSSFGSNGVTTEWPPDTASGNDVAVQPDGGVVVSIGGPITPNLPCCGEGWPQPFGVARFLRTDVPTASEAAVRCHGLKATIVGTNGRDKLKGTKRRDVVAGLGGADRLVGLGGRDVICGGAGKDVLRGGRGRDRLFGGPGGDLLNGGEGRDLLRGGKGRNRLHA